MNSAAADAAAHLRAAQSAGGRGDLSRRGRPGEEFCYLHTNVYHCIYIYVCIHIYIYNYL